MNETTTIRLVPISVNLSDPWLQEYSEPKPDVPLHIIITLIVIGTIGNILVCVSIYIDKKLQNLTNFFLFSLAVTDLLINVIILPVRLLTHVYILRPSQFPLCYSYMFGHDYLVATSAWHICVISAERYFAIKNPLNAIKISKRRIYMKLSFVWLISLLFVIPYIIDIGGLPTYPPYCPHLLTFMDSFKAVIYAECLITFIMMGVVTFFFITTSILLFKLSRKQSTNNINNDAGMIRTVGRNQSENNSKNGKNVIKELNTEMEAFGVVWLVSFAFIISMGPYGILNMIYLQKPNIEIHPIIAKTAAYLTFINSVINPILYTIFNKRFRDNFKNILCFKFQRS